jgi:sugar lactone lactonase YvrE
MSALDVAVCSAAPGRLSEGPRWHEERQELLWVDILSRRFHIGRLASDGALDAVEVFDLDRHVGAAAPAVGGGYVLAAGQGFLFVDPSGSVRELAQPEAGRPDVRMNDGACDRTADSGPERWPTTRRRERGRCTASNSMGAVPVCSPA